MTKRLVLIIIFTSNFLFSQEINFQITKSSIFEDNYKDSKIVLVEKFNEKNDLIIVRSFESGISTSRGFYIEKYGEKLNKINEFTYEIEHPLSEKYSTVIGVFYKDAKVNIIDVFYDLRSKNFICQAHSIDENYKISKKELFRLDRNEVKGFGLQNIFYNGFNIDAMNEEAGNFKLENTSNDFFSSKKSKASFSTNARSEVLMKINEQKSFFSIALTYQNDKKSFLKIFLFDSLLNKKFEKNIINNLNQIVPQNLELNNDLDILYLTEKVYNENLNNKDKGGKYFYQITKITTSGEEKKSLDVQNHYISSLKTFFHNNKLYCIGFYSDEDDFKYGGICYFELDSQKLELSNSKYNLFDEQFILDKYGKLKDKEYKNISLRQVFFSNKGEIFINAEEIYQKSTTQGVSPLGGMSTNSTFYSYDDIITIKLTNNGELVFARNINKRQATSNEDDEAYISYSSFLFKDKNIFFINANDKVKKLSNDRIEFGRVGKNNSNLNLIEIDSKGNFDFVEVLNDESNEVPFMVSKGILIDKSVLFFGRKGKKKQLLKVILE